MNICAACKHVVRRDVGSPRQWCDYNWLCGAKTVAPIPTRDPVTGLAGYLLTNDLGGTYFVAEITEALPQCRKVNPAGHCPMWESEGGPCPT